MCQRSIDDINFQLIFEALLMIPYQVPVALFIFTRGVIKFQLVCQPHYVSWGDLLHGVWLPLCRTERA